MDRMRYWAECGCCRFSALKELVPTQDKADKATFLINVVDYVKQLQARATTALHTDKITRSPSNSAGPVCLGSTASSCCGMPSGSCHVYA